MLTTFRVVERAHRGVGRDGDPAFQGLRLDARDVAGDADGVRSLAGSRSRGRDHGGTLCGGMIDLVVAEPLGAAVREEDC